jgi:hypothetical protein
VFAISSIGKKLFEKLQRKSYRHSYLAEHVRRGIAYQIRALRDQRVWSQGKFAKLLAKPQSVVCRLEDPSYGKLTVQTLLEIASVFDVALRVRFVPYSSFLQQTRDVSVASMKVPSFDDEFASIEPRSISGWWTAFASPTLPGAGLTGLFHNLPEGPRPNDLLAERSKKAAQGSLIEGQSAIANLSLVAPKSQTFSKHP